MGFIRDDGATFVDWPGGNGGMQTGNGEQAPTTYAPNWSGTTGSYSMTGSMHLFARGHTINGFALAKYSHSASDFALWYSNGFGPQGPIPGALPFSVFFGPIELATS